MGLLDFLSSYWLWTIIALFVAKWVFSLVSRKKSLSDRERSVDAKDADLRKKSLLLIPLLRAENVRLRTGEIA